jgi:hypothetical protein
MGVEKQEDSRAHALLSASSADRWLICPPSARMSEGNAGRPSMFAEEGTLAHEFAEVSLRKITKKLTVRKANALLKKLRLNKLYTSEMEPEVAKYTTYVIERLQVMTELHGAAELLIEEKLDYSHVAAEGFGTADAVIIAGDAIEVIDLKYGKGIRVDATGNAQLRMYALGAIHKAELFFDLENVRSTVVQPRLDSVTNEQLTTQYLKKWGEDVVRPSAKLAFAGEGLQKVGDWCAWCRAKGTCATIAADNMRLAKYDFADPRSLSEVQLLEVYDKVPRLVDWAKSVDKHLLDEALSGKKWEGLKLVAGKSSRKWTDEKEARDILFSRGFEESQYVKTQLVGIGEVEKLVSKGLFPEIFRTAFTKPAGKPALVKESDSRTELRSATSAAEDFKEMDLK